VGDWVSQGVAGGLLSGCTFGATVTVSMKERSPNRSGDLHGRRVGSGGQDGQGGVDCKIILHVAALAQTPFTHLSR